MNAVQSAGLKNFAFVDDITAYYKNGESGIVKYDSDSKSIVAIQLNTATSAQSSNPLRFMMCDIIDIHRAEISGEYEAIKKFIDEFGLSLEEDELKVIMKIDRNNTIVKPVTGDYTVTYHKLSKKEYDELSEEEKKEYDEKVAKDQERLVGIPKGRAGIVIDERYPALNRSEYLQ